MTPVDDATLRLLLDERDIQRLMVDYAERIDANDPVGAAACFAPDGVGIYWGEYRGREAIAERLAGILAAFSATSHHLSNVAIDVDPSGDRATALSYVYAFHRRRPSYAPLHVWARWSDQIIRTDEGWRFARREVVSVGRIDPEAGDAVADMPGHPGRLPHRD
jgi:uncharacterized protein (TIGR02246 family)